MSTSNTKKKAAVLRNKKRSTRAVKVKNIQQKKAQRMHESNRAKKVVPSNFYTWENFEELYRANARTIVYNAKLVREILRDPEVAASLEQSPGNARLVRSIATLTKSLTERLAAIHEMHVGKSGSVEFDGDDMDLVFDLYQRYNALTDTIENEFLHSINMLKELQTSPVAFLNEEEQMKLNEVIESKQVKGPEND